MSKEKSLTLGELAKYNQEVLFPFMKENFVNKKEFKKNKNNTIKFQDQVLKDLSDLKQEKTISDDQDKRQKKVLHIHNDALKANKILSEKQSAEIDGLRVF